MSQWISHPVTGGGGGGTGASARKAALETALEFYRGRDQHASPKDIVSAARAFEDYINGMVDKPAPVSPDA